MDIHKRIENNQMLGNIRFFLREFWYLIRSTIRVVPLFLMLYSFVNLVATNAFVQIALRVAMWLKGVTYIGPDNLVSTLKAPTTMIVVLVLCLLISVLSIIEVGGIMHAYSMAKIGKKPTFSGMISAGLHACLKSFHPKNWTIILFVMVLVPLTGFYCLSFASLAVAIPGFIKEYILNNGIYSTLYLVLFGILYLIELSFIFAMNFYFLEETDFITACKKSRRLIAGKYLHTVVVLAIASLLLSASVTALSAVLSSFFVKLLSLVSKTSSLGFASRMTRTILVLNMFLGLILAPGVNIATLTTLFYDYLDENNQMVALSSYSFQDHPVSRRAILALVGSIVVFGAVYLESAFCNPLFTEDTLNRPEIAAHRGDSVNAPENSMPAFELAVLENADWIELDIHQTKDGVIVVSHDEDLSRITGKKVKVHDLTYEEIEQLDTGSWFSKEYQDLHLSTLDEVLKVAKDEVHVQIEIKYTGREVKLEESLLEIINDNGMHDQVVVTSLLEKPLQRVKELDPTMRTAYIMYVASGNIANVECADDYSIEMSNVNEEIVKNVHDSGGRIFVWTVNHEDDVQFLIDCGVDGILTDDPIKLKNVLDNSSYTNGFAKIFRRYLQQLSKF